MDLQRFCNFRFVKKRSLPSLKSICQVTKLSVSNGFGKIELAKPNGGSGRYFFTRFFSSRRPLCRAGSLARSPTRCVAPLPRSRWCARFKEKSGRRSTAGHQGIVVHLASIEGRPEEVACGGISSRGGRRRVVRLCIAKRSRRSIGAS